MVLSFSSWWVAQLAGIGFDFSVIVPSYHLIAAFPLSLDIGFLFGEFQHPPFYGFLSASCIFGVLKEKMSTCPSTPPSCLPIGSVLISLFYM